MNEIMAASTKKCSKCKLHKDPADFYVSKNAKDGRRGRCRSCCAEDNLEAYHKNEEYNRQRVKEYYINNTEKCIVASKRWYYDPKNANTIKNTRRQYRQKNRKRMLEQLVIYQCEHVDELRDYRYDKYWSNPELYRKRSRESFSYSTLRKWREENREKYLLQKAHRRALKMNCKGVCTAEQLKERIAFYGGKCAYCVSGKFESIDHVIPLARGGTNWPSNLRPCCRKCNSSKGARPLSQFLATLKMRHQNVFTDSSLDAIIRPFQGF